MFSRPFAWLIPAVLVAAAFAPAQEPPKEKVPPKGEPTVKYLEFSRAQEAFKYGVVVDIRGLVENPVPGHKYVLRYQYRLHTKKNEEGPLLGDASRPDGRAFDVAPLGKPDGLGWRLATGFGGGPPRGKEDEDLAAKGVEFAGLIDVTRRELSGMTKLPQHASGVVIRVEAQIFDVTAGKFVTPPRTGGATVVVQTGLGRPPAEVLKKEGRLPTYLGSPIPGDRVQSVLPFAAWFAGQFTTPAGAEAALKVLDELWVADIMEEIDSFEKALKEKGVPPAARVLAVRAMPQKFNHHKSDFPGIVKKLADDPDPALKAAAEAWLKGEKK